MTTRTLAWSCRHRVAERGRQRARHGTGRAAVIASSIVATAAFHLATSPVGLADMSDEHPRPSVGVLPDFRWSLHGRPSCLSASRRRRYCRWVCALAHSAEQKRTPSVRYWPWRARPCCRMNHARGLVCTMQNGEAFGDDVHELQHIAARGPASQVDQWAGDFLDVVAPRLRSLDPPTARFLTGPEKSHRIRKSRAVSCVMSLTETELR